MNEKTITAKDISVPGSNFVVEYCSEPEKTGAVRMQQRAGYSTKVHIQAAIALAKQLGKIVVFETSVMSGKKISSQRINIYLNGSSEVLERLSWYNKSCTQIIESEQDDF